MLGFMNKCPKCGSDSHFVLEEAECDKSLLAWCRNCNDYISLTFTLETFRRWWKRYELGEDDLKPPVSKETIAKLEVIEEELRNDPNCYLDKVEIHFKDFADYKFTEGNESNDLQNNG